MFLPSGQLAQLRECAAILAARGNRGAVYWFLRVTLILSPIWVIVFLIFVLSVLWMGLGSPTSG